MVAVDSPVQFAPLCIPSDPLFSVEISEPDINLQGWIVIHSLGASGACGGVRLYPDVSLPEVQELARAMTYKYAFFERTMGGAKAAVHVPFDLPLESRNRLLQAFGAHVAPLLRSSIYNPWTDMNCSGEDLRQMYIGAGMHTGRLGDSSYHTALSAFAGVVAAAEHLGIRPSQCRVTIEGVGNVGIWLAREIDRWGGSVVAASTRIGAVANSTGLDIQQIDKLRAERGDHWVDGPGNWQPIELSDLFAVGAEIHVPCARVHSLTAVQANRLRCRAVVPAANVPCTSDGEAELERKGIVLLPDFIINGGGIVGTGLTELGSDEETLQHIFLVDFKNMCLRMLRHSENAGVTPVVAASQVAHQQFWKLHHSGYAIPSTRERVTRALTWRGLIPRSYRLKKNADHLLRIIHERFTTPITIEANQMISAG